MKILQLNAENIKRLTAVEIKPDGNLVEITGKNGQGKTSVLDAIWWALDTNKVIQTKPVRDGAEKGFIRLDLGDYIVTKKFKVKDGGEVAISLTVENRDGAKYGSPVELLNGFLGDLTFDPLAFSRMKPADQVVALRALVPGFDFDAADKANKADFTARTDFNRTVKTLSSQLGAIVIPDDAPEEPVSAEQLFTELQQAMDKNAEIDRAAAKRSSLDARIEQLEESVRGKRDAIVRYEQQIADARSAIISAEQAIEELRDEQDGLKDAAEKVDIDSIRQRIAEIEKTNRLAALRKQRETIKAELEEAEAQSEALTKAIDDRKKAASDAVKAAELPVDGLELTEDGVLLNGVPFAQASDAEQLRVSVAVAGAMNPKLRVIRVRDGSLLDAESMAALTAYAEQNDLQVWIETVDSGRESAVVIDDGHVAGALTVEAAE